ARGGEADRLQDDGDLGVRLARPHPVEPRRVREVLGRTHLLEEARLDGDAVDEPAHRPRLLEDVVAEDPGFAAVGQEQRREQPDQSRFARAVLAQDRDALAPFHRERDVRKRLTPATANQALPPREDLLQVTNYNCFRHTMLLGIERKTERRRTSTAVSGEASRLRW